MDYSVIMVIHCIILLVSGYMWVSDQVWTIRQLYIEGVYDAANGDRQQPGGSPVRS